MTNFHHSFVLVVPALDRYAYNLFTIIHGPSIYPVSVWGEATLLLTEEQFIEWLGATLSSPDTKRIVSNLFAPVAA